MAGTSKRVATHCNAVVLQPASLVGKATNATAARVGRTVDTQALARGAIVVVSVVRHVEVTISTEIAVLVLGAIVAMRRLSLALVLRPC